MSLASILKQPVAIVYLRQASATYAKFTIELGSTNYPRD